MNTKSTYIRTKMLFTSTLIRKKNPRILYEYNLSVVFLVVTKRLRESLLFRKIKTDVAIPTDTPSKYQPVIYLNVYYAYGGSRLGKILK